MKGAKRILSVFLLLVVLCTFFVFPADAGGNVLNPDPRTWTFGDPSDISFSTLDNGNVVVHSKSGTYIASICSLTPGESYTLRFGCATHGIASNSTYFVGTSTEGNGTPLTLIDQPVPMSYVEHPVKTVKFKVPDDAINPKLYVTVIGLYNTVFYSASGITLEETGGTTGILNSIKEGFSKLWEWLQGIWDSIKEIPTKIGQFITNLGDRISTFFSNLTNSIKGFFDNLWDKIWNGDGSVPPFDNNNKFAQVIEKLNEWTAKIKEFSGSIDSSADTVTGYLQSGTSFLNSAMGAFPAALTAVLGFALVFIVVRKVVGR